MPRRKTRGAPDSDLVLRENDGFASTELPPVEKAPPKTRKPRARKQTPKQVLAEKYGAQPAQVEKYRVEDGFVVCLINWGIKGTKKNKAPLSEFKQGQKFFQE